MSSERPIKYDYHLFARKTRHLSTLEIGALWLLLDHFWEQPSRTIAAEDADRLRLVCKVSKHRWSTIWPLMLRYFFRLDSKGRIALVYSFEYELRVKGGEWAKLRTQVFARDGYRCSYCGVTDVPLECDHVHPVSKGGSSHIDNLAAACVACNRSKRAKTLDEWRIDDGGVQ